MFRRRSRSDYGRVLPTHQWQGLTRGQRFWRALRPWLAVAVIALLSWFLLGPQRIGPEEMPTGPAEVITGPFTRCGQGRSPNCVPDGDTIRIGSRSIRIIGIDAPELHPARCEAEAKLGEAAAQQLLALVNQGPFTLAGPTPPVHDDYGRELRHLLRARPDHSVQSIADEMVASGKARAYLRGPRDPWC